VCLLAPASKAAENTTPALLSIASLDNLAALTNCFEVVHAIVEMDVVYLENDANVVGFEEDSEEKEFRGMVLERSRYLHVPVRVVVLFACCVSCELIGHIIIEFGQSDRHLANSA
jgi:hypothetical protein